MLTNFRIVPIKVALVLLGALLVSACGGGAATRDVWSLTERRDNAGARWNVGEIVSMTVIIRCDAVTCSPRNVGFYLSPNNVISTQDVNIGYVQSSSLMEGQMQTLTLGYPVRSNFSDFLNSNGIVSSFYWGICVTSNQCF